MNFLIGMVLKISWKSIPNGKRVRKEFNLALRINFE
jgi:hypothetical protein